MINIVRYFIIPILEIFKKQANCMIMYSLENPKFYCHLS